MRDPFAGYDQWKTASPYDDQPEAPDWIEDANHWLETYSEQEWERISKAADSLQHLSEPLEALRLTIHELIKNTSWAQEIIQGLLEYLEEDGFTSDKMKDPNQEESNTDE